MLRKITSDELEMNGYQKQYTYTQYSRDNHVNVIPEDDYHKLVRDTFATLADIIGKTYGPYGNSIQISHNGATTITKDGHNVFQSIGFSHRYKDTVRDTIYKICDRVNRSVGDGTSSSILLANHLFRELSGYIDTPDRKRNLLPILEDIEAFLHNKDNLSPFNSDDWGMITTLTRDNLPSIIKVAGNYDHELTELLSTALDPKYDEFGNVIKINNVTVKHTDRDFENIDSNKYSLDFLPGQYRTKVYIDDNPEFPTIMFGEKRKIKILCYNYSFNVPAWELLKQSYNMYDFENNQEELLIISPGINKDFLETAYIHYLNTIAHHANPPLPKICFVPMTGLFMQSRLEDLAAILKVDLRTTNSGIFDINDIPLNTVQLYKDSLCFFDIEDVPHAHIETLLRENNDDKTSPSRAMLNRERIRALQLDTEDSIINVNSSSSLESKIIGDKITDCVSIVRSAHNTGVVPNLLKFGHDYVQCYKVSEYIDDEEFAKVIVDIISESIRNLFMDIWNSKYEHLEAEYMDPITGDESEYSLNVTKAHATLVQFYDNKTPYGDLGCVSPSRSFDIVKNQFVSINDILTSTQYDIEVISAAISIVKYLLDSRAYIFDAKLIESHGDTGEYVMR